MGLSEEQKAIVKAKTQGKLEVELVTAALRSCFPVYKASANRSRRPVTTLIAEPDDGGGPDDDDDSFQDVEAFLADYGFDQPQEDRDEYQEEETAEALAATWKERRKEISKLQQRRGFKAQATDQARRSFRVEIEELKKRTRCRRCNRFGHWARECKAPIRSDGGSSSTTGGPNSSTDANLVQEEYAFVGAAEVVPEAQPNYQTEALNDSAPKVNESLSAGLVSSPGFGVVDSGCGRTLIGKDTLIALTRKLEDVTTRKPDVYQQQSVFRFGNGATEESSQAVRIPVGIAKKLGVIDAAIIEGKAPLLLGRPSLERLRVVLNFKDRTMRFLDQAEDVSMHSNAAGQLLIDVLDFPGSDVSRNTADRSSSEGSSKNRTRPIQDHEERQPNSVTAPTASTPESLSAKDKSPNNPEDLECTEPKNPESPCLDMPETITRSSTKRKAKVKQTLKPKECRCLLAQVNQLECRSCSHTAVAELFCPPRLSEKARTCGATGLSFDIKQGCDLLDKGTQKEVSELLHTACPDLLLACPPCVHWGGWDYLNRCFRTPLERARLARVARQQVRFCIQEIHHQLKRGGHFLFEHPLGSGV